MKKRTSTFDKPRILILISGFVVLLLIIFIFNRPAFYDEDDYLQNVAIINQFGIGREYLLHLIGSAGPLYSVLHYCLQPITHLQMPALRLVNIAFLLGVAVLTGINLQLLKFSERTYALVIMAIPMTYVISGMALTEIPAMFFLSGGIFLMIKATDKNAIFFSAVLYSVAAGSSFSFAIIGRQPYLLILLALPIFFYKKEEPAKSILLLLIILLCSLALPCFIFQIWGGLVAPSDALFYANIANQGISYRPELFLLCLAYYALVIIIIAPGFFITPSKTESLIIMVLSVLLIVINHKFDLVRFLPLKPLFIRLVPNNIDFAEKIAGSCLAITGIYFLLVLSRQLHKTGFKKELLFYAVSIVAIAFSCIKLTHGFSSRYAAQAIPLLIPLGAYFKKDYPYNNFKLAAGVIIGIVSLLMFFLS